MKREEQGGRELVPFISSEARTASGPHEHDYNFEGERVSSVG